MPVELIDSVALLTRQHRMVEDLLELVLHENNNDRRKQLFLQAADHLAVHIKSEEEIFYPAVNSARTEDDLLESLEEHLSLKRLLADLIEMDGADRMFEPKFKVLREQVIHHHKEEEEHLFVKVINMVSKEDRAAMGQQMEVLQGELTLQGEPREGVFSETGAATPLN